MLAQGARLRIRNSFPAAVWQDVDVVLLYLDPLYEAPTSLVSPDSIGPIVLNGERLSIPFRVYLKEPESDRIASLTNRQQLILSAILSRSSNGFVREKSVERLLKSDEPWIPPFVLQLLGEYVLQIILVVQEHSAVLKRSEYRRFVSENPAFMQLLKQRIISYRDCYYRAMFPQLRDYPAFQMFESFKEEETSTIPCNSNELKTLAQDLRRIKAEGWSVFLGNNQIIVRPKDRTTGKFRIRFVPHEKCSVMFFARELNYWNKSKYFDPGVSLAASIKEWMESAAAKPLERVESDWTENRGAE